MAICDSELLGKIFEEGQFQLDVKEGFYKGEEMNEDETREIIIKMSGEDATFNIVGKKSIALAVDVGIIMGEGIKTVQGIPFALVLV